MAKVEYIQEHFMRIGDKRLQKSLFKKSVTDIIIELFTFCNRKCLYCPNSIVDRGGKNTFLKNDVYEKIIENLKEINYDRNICLNLYNEPLAERDYLIEKISDIKKNLPEVFIYLSSNGDYLTKGYLDELEKSGLSKLYITLHPNNNDNYDDLQMLNRFLSFADKLNIPIKFTAIASGRHISSNAKYNKLSIEIFSSNYKDYGQDRGGIIDINPTIKKSVRTAPCNRPFANFTIAYDGNVFPCCQFFPDAAVHRAYIVANVASSKDIFDIYASEEFSAWRLELLTYGPKKKPCDTCTEMNIDEKGLEEDIKNRENIYKNFKR